MSFENERLKGPRAIQEIPLWKSLSAAVVLALLTPNGKATAEPRGKDIPVSKPAPILVERQNDAEYVKTLIGAAVSRNLHELFENPEHSDSGGGKAYAALRYKFDLSPNEISSVIQEAAMTAVLSLSQYEMKDSSLLGIVASDRFMKSAAPFSITGSKDAFYHFQSGFNAIPLKRGAFEKSESVRDEVVEDFREVGERLFGAVSNTVRSAMQGLYPDKRPTEYGPLPTNPRRAI